MLNQLSVQNFNFLWHLVLYLQLHPFYRPFLVCYCRFYEVINSCICTWHRSNGGGTDPSALAGSYDRVGEIRLCRWLYTEMKSCCMRAREAPRGSPSLSIICNKTRPNNAILKCSLATATLYLLPKSLQQKYSGLTRQCQGSVRAHS